MDKQRAAMQAALEFAEFCWREVPLNDWAESQREAVEQALRAALAEQEVEHDPVVWMSWSDGAGIGVWDNRADAVLHSASDHEVQPLYTIPPRREWVGLTEEEIVDLWASVSPVNDDDVNIIELGRAIEAALKEKNG